jgi:hypothetical protein
MIDYIPVIATISGATIGIAGGVLLHRTNNYLASISEKRKLIRQKLEEAHQLILLQEMWALECLALEGMPDGPSQIKSRSSRIVFLCSCYSDDCSHKAELLSNLYQRLLKHFIEHESNKKNSDLSSAGSFEGIMRAYEDCKKESNNLKILITKEVRKNI